MGDLHPYPHTVETSSMVGGGRRREGMWDRHMLECLGGGDTHHTEKKKLIYIYNIVLVK